MVPSVLLALRLATALGVTVDDLGHHLAVEEADVVTIIRAAAAGEVSEGDVARWIRAHLVRRK